MNSTRIYLIYCLLSLIACFSSIASSQQIIEPVPTAHKVLVLFDSNTLSPWKRQFSDSLHARLLEIESATDPIQLSYEFLGLDDLPADSMPGWVLDGLKNKHQLSPADLVISVLPDSSAFLYNYGEDIYPDVKFLYISPDSLIEASLVESPEVSILPGSSTQAIENTVSMLPELLPDLQYLTVISGTTLSDQRYLSVASPSLEQLPDKVRINYMSGISVQEMRQSLSAMPQNSAILLLSYQDGIDSTRGRLNSIVELTNSPIFTVFDPSFIDGVVGGNYTSSALYGRNAADMARSMLSDEFTSADIGIPTLYRFNQPQLQRWGIDEDLLPTGSSIENRKTSLVELYGSQALILLAVVGVLMFFLISSRRQANNLGQQKTLFESVINSIPDAIILTDAEANIFAANSGASEVFGFSEQELLVMNCVNLLGKSAAEGEIRAQIIEDITASNTPVIVNLMKKGNVGFSGEVMTEEIVNAEGKILGFVGLIRDVSKRLSLEEEERQGQKMEALGNLVGGISHDFNNVLGVISGYTELLALEAGSDASRKHTDQILQATERAKSLTAQIMAFSGDNSSTQKTIDLTDLLVQTMKLIDVSIPSNISIETTIDKENHHILGSAIQIEQIIMNLTSNAYQAMKPSNGIISISLERKDIVGELILSHGILGSGKYSVLTIKDNGPGMSSTIRDRAFEPFFTTKGAGEGSGMGLAIVYKLLKTHSATLDLKSAPGKGSKFTLYFNSAEDVNALIPQKESDAVVPGKGERILLVDDEKKLLDATQQLLSSIGYQVEAFSDPEEALAVFQLEPQKFDLLVSDQAMPRITGIQLLSAIRETKPDMLAVICTGYSEVLSKGDVEHLNLSAVVRKPYSLTEISQTVRGAFTNQESLGGDTCR